MAYDVTAVRKHFPALAEGAAHFDGPGGSQVPDVVAEAVAATMVSGIANRGSVTAAEKRATGIVIDARQAMADLLGASPEGIVFGRSMTQLTYDFSRTLAKEWGAGDEIVVSRLDHDANIRPWVQAALAAGATIRWVEPDPVSAELPVETIAAALTDRTRLVAVTGASNLVGTRPDIPTIAAAVHEVGALLYVDGVHLTAHAPVDVTALGADFYACSPYKFLGPHLGALAAAPRAVGGAAAGQAAAGHRRRAGALRVRHAAVRAAGRHHRGGRLPGRPGRRCWRSALPTAGQHGRFGGVRGRAAGPAGDRTGRDRWGDPVRPSGPPDADRAVLGGRDGQPAGVYQELGKHGVNAPAGSFYAIECARVLGLGEAGAVRAGVAPYTDATTSIVDRLLAAVHVTS
ncbi:aminotransferase class V-fold PLP-dependent enzyme [Fodinicola feengrottensis]|uniref:aminotransferase class V-fold PLP-dependent enzyme n=1 Tax=Fodinicola feengrottensis TaxID=435914 RepID=UPI0024433D6F|nr:aminotransferase class V-fold PLP-dependent enzyme [Fodinicola feengrottensis]